MRGNIKKLVTAAVFASLVCVATLVIQIPSPIGGYINLGDSLILMSSAFLPPVYAFFAAAIGSSLADVFLGYMVYAPATFVIKGLMALASHYTYTVFSRRMKTVGSRVVSSAVAECVMVVGYFVFEGFLYSFGSAIINVPANLVQGIAGAVLGVTLINLFRKKLK